jgi:hypothetical protein
MIKLDEIHNVGDEWDFHRGGGSGNITISGYIFQSGNSDKSANRAKLHHPCLNKVCHFKKEVIVFLVSGQKSEGGLAIMIRDRHPTDWMSIMKICFSSQLILSWTRFQKLCGWESAQYNDSKTLDWPMSIDDLICWYFELVKPHSIRSGALIQLLLTSLCINESSLVVVRPKYTKKIKLHQLLSYWCVLPANAFFPGLETEMSDDENYTWYSTLQWRWWRGFSDIDGEFRILIFPTH